MTSTKVPPLLLPYLSPSPPSSLILLTSVLNATANWLVLRFVAAALQPPRGGNDGEAMSPATKVVLVSFLRDWEFWCSEGRRVGFDLGRMSREGRFVFVDGLTSTHGDDVTSTNGRVSMKSLMLENVEKTVLGCLGKKDQGSDRTVLVVDGLDLLIGVMDADPFAMNDILAEWREHVHTTILSVNADSPLMRTLYTPLEVNHAAFVTGIAHQARFVMSVRLLSTGAAKDVSGVLRITRGAGLEDEDEGSAAEIKEMEVLYFVGGDSSVKVFERGADG